MKILKPIAVMLCLVLGFSAFGCFGKDTSPMYDEVHPWSDGSNFSNSETAQYSFARYLTSQEVDEQFLLEGEDKDKGYKLTESGVVTYSLQEGKSVSFEGGEVYQTENSNHTLLTMEMSVKYKDDLAFITNPAIRNIYTGGTDTIKSYAVLDRYTLASLFTYKQTIIQTQAEIDTKSYTLVVDYVGKFTGKRQAFVSDQQGKKSISIKNGTYLDSESVYYHVRAMRSVNNTEGATRDFDIATAYDDIVWGKKKLKVKAAQQRTDAELAKIGIGQTLYELFDIPIQDKDEGFNLACYKTELALTEKKMGPPINLYFSYFPTALNYNYGVMFSAQKVLVQIDYPNHDMASNAIYNQEYILTDYSNSFL